MIFGLIIILILVLFLPFTKLVERNLEVFLFIMGVAAVNVSQTFTIDILKEALIQPINITLAVLFAGLFFRWFQTPLEKTILTMSQIIPYRLFIGLFVIVLGFISSLITAIMAAIILVTVLSVLKMDRESQIWIVVLTCFAIGMGAALTPIGEPLSAIITGKLDEKFFYLLKLIGAYVVSAIIGLGILAAIIVKAPNKQKMPLNKMKLETYREIVIRGLKIYLFIMALTFLGAGFQPFIEKYLLDLNPLVLYWINIVSAILDNATLAAAEISPVMSDPVICNLLLGLIISGGMLIPGNIPNIIAAGKFRITSIEYARAAVPIGLLVMLIYFIVLLIVG